MVAPASNCMALDSRLPNCHASPPFLVRVGGSSYFAALTCAGASLVLMAEEPGLANNAQMGSAAGHPIWPRVMARMLLQAHRGVKDPLYATGPRVITAALRVSGFNARIK